MKTISKICSKCKSEYPATPEYFRCDKSRYDNLFPWCKKCKSEGNKKYYKENIEKINKQSSEWRKNNKEITKIRDQKYREKMKGRREEDIKTPKTKKCPKCEKEKLAKEFYKDRNKKIGLTFLCKDCCKIKNAKTYRKYKEKIAQNKKSYYKKNRNKIRRYKKLWQQKNVVKIAKRQKEWRQINRCRLNEYSKNRRTNDLSYRILNNLRGRLYYALKAQGAKKCEHTVKLIGCSIAELRRYIESHFLKGMTFENYGKGNEKWSIDHIRPCSSFNLSNFSQQKLCFHHSNLKPMWNLDNFSKNSFYNGKYIRKNREVK